MIIGTFDLWIGKNLFVPPIVSFCQPTRQSQYVVSRCSDLVAVLDGFYRADTVLSAILFGALSSRLVRLFDRHVIRRRCLGAAGSAENPGSRNRQNSQKPAGGIAPEAGTIRSIGSIATTGSRADILAGRS